LNLTRAIEVTIYCYEINFIVTSKSRTQKKQLIVIDQLWHLVREDEDEPEEDWKVEAEESDSDIDAGDMSDGDVECRIRAMVTLKLFM